jgi:uncharacterized damage-inducible protein DinB
VDKAGDKKWVARAPKLGTLRCNNRDMSHLVDFARYKAWADDRLFAALARLPQSELTAPRPIVFGSILGTLNHMYVTDQLWQARLHGRPHGFSARARR